MPQLAASSKLPFARLAAGSKLRSARFRAHSVLPGFNLALGYQFIGNVNLFHSRVPLHDTELPVEVKLVRAIGPIVRVEATAQNLN